MKILNLLEKKDKKNILILSSNSFLPLANFLISILISHIYNSSDIGIFFFYNFIISLNVFIIQFGSIPFLQRSLGQGQYDVNSYVNLIIFLSPIGFLINLIIFYLYSLKFDSLFIFISSFVLAFINILIAEDLIKGNGIKYFFFNVLISFYPLISIFILFQFDITYFSKVLSLISILLFLIIYFKKNFKLSYTNFKDLINNNFTKFLSVFLHVIISNFVIHIDKYLITYYFSYSDLAGYVLLVQLSSLMLLITNSFSSIAAQYIFKCKSIEDYKYIFKTVTLRLLLIPIFINSLIVILFVIYSPYKYIYGDDIKINSALSIYVYLIYFLYSFTHLFINYFHALNISNKLFIFSIIAFLTNILFSFLFYPFFGILGFVLATLISMIILLLLTTYSIIRTIYFNE